MTPERQTYVQSIRTVSAQQMYSICSDSVAHTYVGTHKEQEFKEEQIRRTVKMKRINLFWYGELIFNHWIL